MIIKQDFVYTPNGENRILHIYLPDEYPYTSERYPVMYYFDGHNLFSDKDATYGVCWGLKDMLNQWGKKMIVVGFECGHEKGQRMSEYSPYSFSSKYWGEVKGQGYETMEWIVNDVKPYIDSRYRTYSFREACGIAGSSMGGLMALYGVCKFNETFSKAACLSSALGFNWKDVKYDVKIADIDPDTRVYMSIGEHESSKRRISENEQVLKMLEKKQATCDFYFQEGGYHCEADWSKQNERYLNFLWCC